MKLKEFVEKLTEILEKRGENVEVIMADGIPVVDPVFLDDDGKVVITDEG